MKSFTYIIFPFWLFLGFQSSAFSAPTDAIMLQGESVVTQQDFDAQISKIPKRDRGAYLVDGERAKKSLQQLMLFQRIADDAKMAGFDKDPNVQLRLRLAEVQALAEAYLGFLEEEKLASIDLELIAKEYYLVHKNEFNNPGSIDISHILIGLANRTEAQARSLIDELYSKLKADPRLWDEYVMEYTEDMASRGNAGKYLGVVRGKMVKPFEDAAFALKNNGDITEPVQTEFGFHIIRLEKIHETEYLPFEAVKHKIISQQRQIYLKKTSNDYISYINTSDPVIIPDCALDEMYARYFKTTEAKLSLKNCLLDKAEKDKQTD